jgi:dTMP kinase
VTRFPLVVIEGIDGSGKTTLRNYVWNALLERSIPTVAMGQHSWLDVDATRRLVLLRSAAAPRIRAGENGHIRAAYLRDKQLHFLNAISSARSKCVVLLDRYFLSDAVYLDAIYGIDYAETIRLALEEYGVGVPDILVFLDIDAQHAERRVIERGRETKHYEEAVALGRIRQAYHTALRTHGRGTLYASHYLELSSRTPAELTSAGAAVAATILRTINTDR